MNDYKAIIKVDLRKFYFRFRVRGAGVGGVGGGGWKTKKKSSENDQLLPVEWSFSELFFKGNFFSHFGSGEALKMTLFVPQHYVFSIGLFTISFFFKTNSQPISLIQRIEMSKFSCSLSCTWTTIIDRLFYASQLVLRCFIGVYIAKSVVAWL